MAQIEKKSLFRKCPGGTRPEARASCHHAFAVLARVELRTGSVPDDVGPELAEEINREPLDVHSARKRPATKRFWR